MATLKEIKERFNTVKSTRKITNAMRMVSSAKLHKAQQAIKGMLLYEQALESMLAAMMRDESVDELPFTAIRPIKSVAIVALSSNSSLCGAFNTNVIKAFNSAVSLYRDLGKENILVYPIGKKIAEAVIKAGFTPSGRYEKLSEKPNFKGAEELASLLMQLFLDKKVDRVVLIYNHFKSAGSQEVITEDYLPIKFESVKKISGEAIPNYIIEPDKETLIRKLLPKTLSLKMYTILLDSSASEHVARMIAMHTASDNADKLISELTIQYNKTRQQSITNELLDIIGGSFS